MSIMKTKQAQGGKPSGVLGTLIGRLMNMSHGNIHAWGLRNIPIREEATGLDIGCGGGNAVKVLAEKANKGNVHGLDHSAEMVALAQRLNRAAIAREIVEIHQRSVSALPFSDDCFDLVTAFETIQFWPDIQHDVMEVKRVLKPSGSFLIVNRYPPEHSQWADFLQLKNANAYADLLNTAGFQAPDLDTTTKPGWIKVVVQACTPSLKQD